MPGGGARIKDSRQSALGVSPARAAGLLQCRGQDIRDGGPQAYPIRRRRGPCRRRRQSIGAAYKIVAPLNLVILVMLMILLSIVILMIVIDPGDPIGPIDSSDPPKSSSALTDPTDLLILVILVILSILLNLLILC